MLYYRRLRLLLFPAARIHAAASFTMGAVVKRCSGRRLSRAGRAQ